MAAPYVLFVPGLPDDTPQGLLTHRFGHALAVGGQGAPVLLPNGSYEAVAWGLVVDKTALAPACARRKASTEELQFYEDIRDNIEAEGPNALDVPDQVLLIDPLLHDSKDPATEAVRCFFAPMWDYLTNRQMRYMAQTIIMQALQGVTERPLVVLAHGIGSVAAMDVLFKMGNDAPQFELVTFGSPLGLNSVKRRLKVTARQDRMQPVPECIRRWTNLSSPRDPVCGDPTLGDEFRWNSDPTRRVEDKTAKLEAGWPHHAWQGYLRSAELRQVLAEALVRATNAFHMPKVTLETPAPEPAAPELVTQKVPIPAELAPEPPPQDDLPEQPTVVL